MRQESSPTLDSVCQDSNLEISIINILCFLKESYQSLIALGLLGAFLAVVYLVVVSPKYEAIAQIEIARICAASNINSWGINIEDPALLAACIYLPTSFSLPVISACSFERKDKLGTAISKSKSRIVRQPLPLDDPKQCQPNIELANESLGWEPKINVEDDLKETTVCFKRIVA